MKRGIEEEEEEEEEPLFTPEQAMALEAIVRMDEEVPSELCDDVDEEDMPGFRDEPGYTHIPEPARGESWLQLRQRLDAAENVAHVVWRQTARQLVRDPETGTNKSVRVALIAPAEQVPASERTVKAMYGLPCVTWVHILRTCSVLDVLALSATCQLMRAKFSMSPTHMVPLSNLRGVIGSLAAATGAWSRGELSAERAMEIIEHGVAPLQYMATTTDHGVFNWPLLLREMSVHLMVPHAPMKRRRELVMGDRVYLVDNQAFKTARRDAAWADASLARARFLFRTGGYCMGCLRKIRYRRTVPRAWKEYAAMPQAMCFPCLTLRRNIRTDLNNYLVPGATQPDVRCTAYDNPERSLENLECPHELCRGAGLRLLRRPFRGAEFGVGYCTHKDHPMFFTFIEYRGATFFCHEEVQRWVNRLIEPTPFYRAQYGDGIVIGDAACAEEILGRRRYERASGAERKKKRGKKRHETE